ncbi:putative membrane protein [Volucribacter psittacicida]|uniref:Putative membrane protein n=1 Tax=Volucribacter psittacicida TaxID=203482 RepID=A0A4R1FX59_9PAST|nr:DUF1440 domain-containing protein [Volucribacter psittacicida]TCJ98324.1 putative membrane protein [Volucribacter psittacicida]
MNLFERTQPQSRHYGLLIIIGIIAGFISALVKSGWEDIVPPRSPNITPPPIELLQMFGIDTANLTYTWLDVSVNWGGNGVHILFSIVFAIIYCVLAEIFPKTKLLQGAIFGYAAAFGSHYIVFPILGLYAPFQWLGFISELGGSFLWIWAIEITRAYLRKRWTGYDCAEVEQRHHS